MIRKRAVLRVVVCMMRGSGSAAWAEPDPWFLSAGSQYTSGDYGGSRTITETFAPLTAGYRFPWAGVWVTVPYVSVSGPATIIDDTTGDFSPGPGGARSGLGDGMLSGTLYDLTDSGSAGLYLDLTGTVKFATGSASAGLGTGESDYAVQLEALRELGRSGVFGTAGYVARSGPGRVNLRDVPFGEAGADVLLGAGVRAGMSFAYRTSPIARYESVQETAVFVAFAAPDGVIVHPLVFKGFGDSTASWGAGVRLTWQAPSSEGSWVDEPIPEVNPADAGI